LRVQLNKSEIKDQNENGAKLWCWYLNLAGVKLHAIKKFFMSIKSACATIERTKIKLKPFQIPNYNP
jgi:hypothetical protein